MGILDFFRGGKVSEKNGVRGTALVTSCTAYHEGSYQTCRMHLVIQADGVPATPVEFSGLVHNQKWPQPGMTLPVTVDPADPTRFSIEWGDVPKSRDRSAANAAAIAAAMRGSAGAGQPGAAPLGGMLAGAQVINLSGRDPSQLTDEQRAKLQMLGIDPAALASSSAPTARPPGFPNPPAAPLPPSAPTSTTSTGRADDTISRLERLAALRAQGVLTESEFQAQKRAILGGG